MMEICLVTGGNRGIGFAVVEALAEQHPNATIIIGCRQLEAGHKSIAALKAAGVKATLDAVRIDIDNDDSIVEASQLIDEKYSRVDVLINNAAGFSFPKSQELGEIRKNSNEVFNNCVSSSLVVTRAFTPLLRRSQRPRVIFTSSARASLSKTASKELPPTRIAAYCVAKAALNMLLLQLQLEEDGFEGDGRSITYWSVSPGHTKTAFNNFQGKKDPKDSARVFTGLLQSKPGEAQPGTFWEHEGGELSHVPW